MQVTHIRLHDFRSYGELAFAPAPALSVFVGENAAGKTNILEALFLCALGRSHRTRHDGELIRYASPAAAVHLTLQKRSGTHDISAKLYRDARRELTIDGKSLSRSGELLGCLHVVMFAPEDLRLIKQGPAERRRFLDMELSQLYPAYYYTLQQYNTALRQRNALLRDSHATSALYAPWEEQLARLGAQIIEKRAEFTASLAQTARALHHELSGGRETLLVEYQATLRYEGAAGAQEALYEALVSGRSRDALRGGTSAGPHRDDLALTLDGVDVRAYGSQGQQRTAALSLKLSELALLKQLDYEPPVLLLDDVLSELDCARQAYLAHAMKDCQTFLTCTQLAGLKDAGICDMTVFEVRDGAVVNMANGNT